MRHRRSCRFLTFWRERVSLENPIFGKPGQLPAEDGLYSPEQEHDACGVGFVAHIKGVKSHSIIEKAVNVLKNLAHRGATGSDPHTGDGAGILIQIPDAFYREQLALEGVTLPNPGEYAVGMLFLPTISAERNQYEAILEEVVTEEGQSVIAWRDVPVDRRQIGVVAQSVEPVIRQIFIGRGANCPDEAAFERKLFIIRRVAQKRTTELHLEQEGYYYLNSLSCTTVVYKGLLLADKMDAYYSDLGDTRVVSSIALVHQRFSTNTFPTWDLAHPFRYIAHNGEINTLRGNRNWMSARQKKLTSKLFGDDVKKLGTLVNRSGSDSATLDNALELLTLGGRSLCHSMMMLIPEAWGSDDSMDPAKKAFYEYQACQMEPWDGPAAVVFTDGKQIGALLDRNGLRPARYLITDDDLVVLASETGVMETEHEHVIEKGRLQPGKIFLIDTVEGRIIPDEEIKRQVSALNPYEEWMKKNRILLSELPDPENVHEPDHDTILTRQQIFGYTLEDLKIILQPMAMNGEQPLGSMGTDTPLAVLSNQAQLLYGYFKQLFAQVTNPPIDPIREELVMSLVGYIGKDGNLFDEEETHARQLKLESPILSNIELAKIRDINQPAFSAKTLSMLFVRKNGVSDLQEAIDRLCIEAEQAVEEGFAFIILSDRGVDETHIPIPSLLATSAVHHHLVKAGTRNQVGIIVESGEAREVQHFALLISYGASAINPYLAFESLADLIRQDILKDVSLKDAQKQFIKAVSKGLLKTFAKMGISTLQSYRGAQIFEAIGLDQKMVHRYFSGTPSRLGGVGLDVIEKEALIRHEFAYPPKHIPESLELETGGQYQWRRAGEYHQYNPETVSKLQHAVRQAMSPGESPKEHDPENKSFQRGFKTFKEFTKAANDQSKGLATLRGLLKFKPDREPIPLAEVEPAFEIVKRFATGAMSLGSISREAHETLAIAMNRIGGKSNTGEGGEDPVRYQTEANGDRRRSAIKQIASARFGVTTHYLVNADELQIKMAQGAKPGEGGELPGHKVDDYIAKVRHTTPGVTLVSPPPHHDIYSIEDLAQLIFDLKNVNQKARISVKLVSEVGVGTVAAGVSKAHADHVLISGHDGGTGASPVSSIKYAGIPWEMGLAETQQTLVKNNLRSRITVQTDGQLKTGRDVAIAALLGAEEFGFASAPLVAMGCIMMRVCHLGTCPVGIATQDPVLRERFTGQPEMVINFLFFVAEELREIMAQLGYDRLIDLVGRVDLLDADEAIGHWKTHGLDLTSILKRPEGSENAILHCTEKQNHGLEEALDLKLIHLARPALELGKTVSIDTRIYNRNRTVGTMLSSEVALKYGEKGLPDDTIRIKLTGSAGQSLGAFLAPGISITLEGDTNDYLGKGMSGGRIVVYPPKKMHPKFDPSENIIAGNTLLYGATAGEVYLRGVVGERFAVRNSGANAVVGGTGDHGCEYMTGGTVVVLGKTGRNFAAGMSGGVAYVYDRDGDFHLRLNNNYGKVKLEPVVECEDEIELKTLIENHLRYTGSSRAETILAHWETELLRFKKVISEEYKNLLAKQKKGAGNG